jgi:hypothetical protein
VDDYPSPAQLRDALHVIERRISDYITRARLGRTA